MANPLVPTSEQAGLMSRVTSLWPPAINEAGSPPASPVTGDRYLILSPLAGSAFEGHGNAVAQWNGSAWVYSEPQEGVAIRLTAQENRLFVYDWPRDLWVNCGVTSAPIVLPQGLADSGPVLDRAQGLAWANDAAARVILDHALAADALALDGDEALAHADLLVVNNTGADAALCVEVWVGGAKIVDLAAEGLAADASARLCRIEAVLWRATATTGRVVTTLLVSSPSAALTAAGAWFADAPAAFPAAWDEPVSVAIKVRLSTAHANFSAELLRAALARAP